MVTEFLDNTPATTATEAAPAEEMAASACLFFEKLPKEIRDLVYGFAYGQEDGTPFKLTPLSKWAETERIRRTMNVRRGLTFTPKAIGPRPMLEMMINKQFCEEAVYQWLRITTIQCATFYDLNDVIENSHAVLTYLAHFRCTWSTSNPLGSDIFSEFKRLKWCDKLQSLHLTVKEGVFKLFDSRLCCVDDYSDRDFDGVQEVQDLLGMELSSVNLEASKSELAANEEEKQKWQANVAALEVFINRKLKAQEAARMEKAKAEANMSPSHGSRSRSSRLGLGLMKGKVDMEPSGESEKGIPIPRTRVKGLKRRLENLEVSRSTELPSKKTRISFSRSPTGVQKGMSEALARAAAGKRISRANGSSHQDCGSLMGFTRQHPAAAALMSTAFALSVINSVVLMKQML